MIYFLSLCALALTSASFGSLLTLAYLAPDYLDLKAKVSQLRDKLESAYSTIDKLKHKIGHDRTDNADWWKEP